MLSAAPSRALTSVQLMVSFGGSRVQPSCWTTCDARADGILDGRSVLGVTTMAPLPVARTTPMSKRHSDVCRWGEYESLFPAIGKIRTRGWNVFASAVCDEVGLR